MKTYKLTAFALMGTFTSEENFFEAFVGADYKRCLWIYEITRFIVLVRVEWLWLWGEGWWKALNVRGRGVTKIKQVRTWGEAGGVHILVILWMRNNWMPPSAVDGPSVVFVTPTNLWFLERGLIHYAIEEMCNFEYNL